MIVSKHATTYKNGKDENMFVVKRYAVRNVKRRPYAVRGLKMKQYAVCIGVWGFTLMHS